MNKTVVHINVTANWGSTGKICEGICNLAEQDGWTTYIAFGRHVLPGNIKTLKIGKTADTYKHLIGARLFDKQGLYSKSATRQFVKRLQELKPDIVHLHNIHGYFLNYEVLFEYLKSNNIPVVWTLHDCWPFTGHCVYFDVTNCVKWKEGCNHCPQKGSYPSSVLLSRSTKNWIAKKDAFSGLGEMTFVPVSHWLDGFLKDSFLKDYPSRVIHNGIDVELFSPVPDAKKVVAEKYGVSPQKKIVIGVANLWDRRKGLDDFVKLSLALDEEKFTSIIVGVDKKQKQQLPSGVVGIERTDSVRELATLYSAADVYVNPTYSDTYPTTNLEATACGTPVITYNTGGSPESVTPHTGKVIEQGNLKALVGTVNSLCEIDNREISMACRQYAKQNFDRLVCFKEYIDMYDRIMERNCDTGSLS